MKKLIAGVALVFFLFVSAGSVEAKTVNVRGYYKPSTGAYVQPSHRTSPNNTRMDNYSTRGNYNPYTGKAGRANPYRY
ncbi:MAG: hypothetical protein WCT45_00085 [Candidatus Paceibacterota bacterium]|jgi:hypothetical protein